MKKRERPIPFPEYDSTENNIDVQGLQWEDIRPGQRLKLGKPSNRYFEYIYPSLNFSEHRVYSLKELSQFEGTEVLVTSILKMKNGTYYAVLDRMDGTPFSKRIARIYAELEKSFLKNELTVI
ncbi:hypothetical protein [Maribacter sp. 2210JD10-5]|uniref:hypothetical protein n=1 Tax=Maribacter sp. 2210JD10-5 TaxID=3386272 RepID=UPI0039BD73E1